jgi:hypothetical protein
MISGGIERRGMIGLFYSIEVGEAQIIGYLKSLAEHY